MDSLGWWARGRGLQASSSVIVDLDGRIVRCVPDDRGPWTNGEVRNPSARGKALLARFPGVNPNVHSVTLEAEGFSDGEHPEAQLRSIAWMCRAWMTRHGLSIEDIYRHSDVDSVERGHCPGPLFEQVVNALSRDV